MAMLLQLEAIKFNHDSSSAGTDAFNIRKNEREFVEVPEWRRGVSLNPEDSPAAYALFETRGNTLTIEANFSRTDHNVETVNIRAVDGRIFPGPDSFSSTMARLLRPLLFSSVGNVLGEVATTRLSFSQGESGFQSLELNNVRIWDAGVGRQEIVWHWQYQLPGTAGWTDFATTTHRIYTVLQVPKQPWLQTPHNQTNSQLPWVEVLDYACNWAAGTQNTNDAAASITDRIHELGLGTFVYDGSSFYTDGEFFDCGSILNALKGGIGGGARVNCDDCAAMVSTFANAVGCNLEQLCVTPQDISSYRLKPHRRIGTPGWLFRQEFFHHSVASEGCGETDEVFDACLQVDGNDVPGRAPRALLPTNFRFGQLGERGYRFRLVVPEDEPACVLGNCKRRRLGASKHVLNSCADGSALEQHFDFASWASTEGAGARLFVSDFFLADHILPDWTVVQVREDNDAQPPSIQSFWKPDDATETALMRIDTYECISWPDARDVVLSLLTSFQGPGINQQDDSELGDVAFADPGFYSILFATGNLVFLLRNVGKTNISLADAAKAINNAILNPSGSLAIHHAVKQFEFETGEAVVGERVRIVETPADPSARRRLYQFFSDKGETSRADDKLSYEAKSAGSNTLEIFAVDVRGNVVKQVLTLNVNSDSHE